MDPALSHEGVKRQILIVDRDEETLRDMVRELRTRKSFVIHTFSSGSAAREALHQTHFDLLIAEKELPMSTVSRLFVRCTNTRRKPSRY